MDTHEVEQLAALATNWREAEEINDKAASEAFEDELHARTSKEQINNLKLTGPETGDLSSGEIDWLQGVLQKMRNNASARLG